MNGTKYPKRLIEVDLPIKKISQYSVKEKKIKKGNISTLHIWWARRPLAACRAVICAALWPDPADPLCPQEFIALASETMQNFWDPINAGKKDFQNTEIIRETLLDFIAEFSNWDNCTNKKYLDVAQKLTKTAHESLGGTKGSRPIIVDPFAGGGSIPLEGLRIGAESFASDLNPIPVILNKLILEYIPKYKNDLTKQVKESAKRIRSSLQNEFQKYYFEKEPKNTPVAYLWSRTIKCEGPSCGYTYPLFRSLWLSQKSNRNIGLSLQPNKEKKSIDIDIVFNTSDIKSGTSKLGSAICPVCEFTTPVENVRTQLSERNGGSVDAQLFAIVEKDTESIGRKYRKPTNNDILRNQEAINAWNAKKKEKIDGISTIPDEKLNHLRGFFNVVLYGMKQWGDLLSPRQTLLMITITKLIREEHLRLSKEKPELADAVTTCLALIAGQVAKYNSSCCRWNPKGEAMTDMFGRQAIPMVWDYAEIYPFSGGTGDYFQYAEAFCKVLDNLTMVLNHSGSSNQASATNNSLPDDTIDAFVTDPPYYAAIPYADLSDYFYVWLRRMIGPIHSSLFITPLSPKDEECVMLAHRAAMYRNKDRNYFEKQMSIALTEGKRITKPNGIGIVVFANTETEGWEAMLAALISSGWIVTASWPIDTEMVGRLRALNSAVLGSSVHLVCRPRELKEIGDWRNILEELPIRIHEWMPKLAKEGVAGADAIFSCLGPALEIFSRYSKVEKASGEDVKLHEYLEHVWAAVSKEALNMIFKGADASGFEEDARITAMWLWIISTTETLDISEDEIDKIVKSSEGFILEFDAARKIAQSLGVHLEQMPSIIKIEGNNVSLLPVESRRSYLFENQTIKSTYIKEEKSKQITLFGEPEVSKSTTITSVDDITYNTGKTILDQVHQSMLLFADGKNNALKRLLVEKEVGNNPSFWRLAQSLSALYPLRTQEKRWIDGVLARKKSLGF